MNRLDARATGTALCLVSASGYGAIAIFAKLGYEQGLTVSGSIAGRFVIASAVLWLIIGLVGRWRPSRRGFVAAFALGAVVYGAQVGFYFLALTRLDASLTVLLVYVAPVLVAVAAVVFGREQVRPVLWIALLVALAGTALVAVGGGVGSLDGLGVVYAMGCAVAFAAYMLLSHAVVERVHPIGLSASVCTGVAVAALVVSVARGELPDTGGEGWLLIVAMALLSTVVAITALAAGTERVGPSAATVISTFEPVVATLLAVLILDERLAWPQWIGGAFVVASVAILGRFMKARDATNVDESPLTIPL